MRQPFPVDTQKNQRRETQTQRTGSTLGTAEKLLDFTCRSEVMAGHNFGERTLTDFQNWSKFGKQLFYERNPNDEKEIRIYRPFYNVFAGKYTLQITPYHVAEPTADMKPWHPSIGRALTTMQPVGMDRGFY